MRRFFVGVNREVRRADVLGRPREHALQASDEAGRSRGRRSVRLEVRPRVDVHLRFRGEDRGIVVIGMRVRHMGHRVAIGPRVTVAVG